MKKKPAKKKKITVTQAKKKAWKAFSAFIRVSAAVDDYVTCYTCDKSYHWKEMQAGHWIEGRHNAVLLVEEYVRPQCFGCNIGKRGNQGEFRDRMRKEIGDKEVDRLIKEAKQTKEITIDDYIELEKWYLSQTHG